MPTIKIDTFGGMQPRLHPTLLPDGMAIEANNCRLKNGKLVPLKESKPLLNLDVKRMGEGGEFPLSSANTIYLWDKGKFSDGITDNKQFLAWKGKVRIARSNIADDKKFRIFLTGDTGEGQGKKEPCVLIQGGVDSADSVQTLVKESLDKPVVTRSSSQSLDKNNIRYTRFFQTWVDQFGYESGSSLPSENTKAGSSDLDFEYNDGDSVSVGAINTPPALAKKRRIYKVVTGTETDSIQFVFEQDVLNGTFPAVSFTVKDEDAGEVMPMFKSPPEDLVWMTYVENGFYCGFRDSNRRRVLFSGINLPSTWPDAYEYSIADNIVGLATVSNNVFVLTEGNPWLISGTSPDGMSVMRIGASYSCVSEDSICVYNNSVFYASNVGVCLFTPERVVNLTDKIWTKEQWESLNPSKCLMAEYDGALFIWFRDNSGRSIGNYILDLTEQTPILTTHDDPASCIVRDLETDTLYFIMGE